MTDLIFDFETFGQNIFSAPAINCALFKFDRERFKDDPYTYDEILAGVKLLKLDVTHQVKKLKYVIEPSSIQFWSKRPPEVQEQTKPRKDDLSPVEFIEGLISYLDGDKIDYWWSRSNSFDPVILYRIANDCGKSEAINKALKFWRVRDIRTFIDAKTDFQLDMNAFIPLNEIEWKLKFREHDCRHDVTGDVLRMQLLVRAENGLS